LIPLSIVSSFAAELFSRQPGIRKLSMMNSLKYLHLSRKNNGTGI